MIRSALVAPSVAIGAVSADDSRCPVPYVKGMLKHILLPPGQRSDPAKRQWYINDHCFFVSSDGTIHWYGIANPYPENGNLYGPGSHRHIAHATAKSPFGPWEALEDALALPEESQDNIGASFVVQAGDGYVMLYGYNEGFATARSSDLAHWTASEDAPKIDIGCGTRDPCIIEHEGKRLLYCACGFGDVGSVGLAESEDLVHWQKLEPALISDMPGDWGSLESPFVLCKNGWFYLLVNNSHHQYEETLVFASKTPYRFDWNNPLCTIFAHAAEVLTWEGRTYISHCGIEDRHWDDTDSPYGLYLAELEWTDQAQERS